MLVVARQEFIKWYFTPGKDRQIRSFKGWALANGVKIGTVKSWAKKIKKGELGEGFGTYDSIKYLSKGSSKADAALMKACEKGNAQALRTFYQLTRKLEQKEEVKEFELTASDYIAYGQNVVNGLRAEFRKDGGSCPVCGFSKVLHDQLCQDTRREQNEHAEVETVAISS